MVINRLKLIRKDRNFTQREIAELLGVSAIEYNYYENNSRNIPLKRLIKLALYYNTSVDYLIGLTDSVIPYPRCNKTLIK